MCIFLLGEAYVHLSTRYASFSPLSTKTFYSEYIYTPTQLAAGRATDDDDQTVLSMILSSLNRFKKDT